MPKNIRIQKLKATHKKYPPNTQEIKIKRMQGWETKMQKVGILSESEGRCCGYALLRYFQMYPKMYLDELHWIWVIWTSDFQNARAIYFFRGWAEQAVVFVRDLKILQFSCGGTQRRQIAGPPRLSTSP
jgi:hypothetical protein